MIADIDIKHYYAKFIEQSKSEYEDNKKNMMIQLVLKENFIEVLMIKLILLIISLNQNYLLDNDKEMLVVDYDAIRNKVKTWFYSI